MEGLFPPHRPLPESAKLRITTRTKFLEQVLKSEVFMVGEGLVGTVARTGKGILIENALDDPRVVKHDDPALVVRSIIVVPIQFRERNLGVLAIVNPSDGGPFGETDFSLATSLAEQAGLAIHNLDLLAYQIEKNKLDSELGLANEIQSMLLPRQFHVSVVENSTEAEVRRARWLFPLYLIAINLFVIPIALGSSSAVAIASRAVRSVTSQISVASCSTQPGWGKCWVNSRYDQATLRPEWSNAMARTPVVPASMAMTTAMPETLFRRGHRLRRRGLLGRFESRQVTATGGCRCE